MLSNQRTCFATSARCFAGTHAYPCIHGNAESLRTGGLWGAWVIIWCKGFCAPFGLSTMSHSSSSSTVQVHNSTLLFPGSCAGSSIDSSSATSCQVSLRPTL